MTIAQRVPAGEDDPLGGAAEGEGLAQDRGHRDEDADVLRGLAEPDGDALTDRDIRFCQSRDGQRRGDQGEERVQPQDENPADHHAHADQQDPEGIHASGSVQ